MKKLIYAIITTIFIILSYPIDGDHLSSIQKPENQEFYNDIKRFK